MQTFLPYPNFSTSMACLDFRRLGKQRVEARQILKALTTGTGGWQKHPCTRQWAGYEPMLAMYLNGAINEWVRRGYRNTMIREVVKGRIELPWWLGNEDYHASHRAALLYKDPEHYGQFGWLEEPKLDYVWPDGRSTCE